MKFGLFFQSIGRHSMVQVAQDAERLGFESVWRPDHLILPAEMSGYPYTPSGRAAINPDWPILDPFSVFSFLATETTTLRFGTGVYILPLRNPIVTAKALVSADHVTQGRMMLGVGAGWWKAEFDAVGEDFSTRGKRTDEYIEVIRALCSTPGPVSFRGSSIAFEDCRFEPKPIQEPSPPILVGGDSGPALRRAARHGDGWYGHRHSPEDAKRYVDRLAELRRECGRCADPFEITLSGIPGDISLDEVRAFAEAGVHRLVVSLWRVSAEATVRMEEFADRIVSECGD